jgi:hypothetical protein
MASRALYRALWIPSAIILVGLTVAFAKQPEAFTAPAAEAKTFTTDDKTITVRYPGNWKPRQTSMNAVLTQVEFEPSRNVRCVITTDLAGSLMGDLSKSNSGLSDSLNSLPGMENRPLPKQKTPLETVHEMQGQMLEKDYRDKKYAEGATRPGKVAGYDALITDFTFEEAGLFESRKMIGTRVSALSGERRITVVATCPKEAQILIMPAFEAIIESLQTGG